MAPFIIENIENFEYQVIPKKLKGNKFFHELSSDMPVFFFVFRAISKKIVNTIEIIKLFLNSLYDLLEKY